MTEDDKMKLFLEMTDHPERFTDEELQRLLADEDMRGWYELLSTAADARAAKEAAQPSAAEVDDALASITGTAYKPQRRWLRIAASVVGIVLLSGIVYASVRMLQRQPTPTTTPAATVKADTIAPEQQSDTLPAVKTFDDMPLEAILATVARHYALKVEYKEQALKALRLHVYWYPQKSVDHFIEVINQFDGIHIVHQGEVLTVEPTTEEGTE